MNTLSLLFNNAYSLNGKLHVFIPSADILFFPQQNTKHIESDQSLFNTEMKIIQDDVWLDQRLHGMPRNQQVWRRNLGSN